MSANRTQSGACHPEEGEKPSEGPYEILRADAVDGIFSQHAACSLPSTSSKLAADVRSLTPASPPLRMTTLQ